MQCSVMECILAALAPFGIISTLPSMLPWSSLHVQQCLLGSSVIMEMFYICLSNTIAPGEEWLFKFIKTKLKIPFISHVASD